MTRPVHFEDIEADVLSRPMTVKDMQPLAAIKPNPAEITIQRGEDLQIILELRGVIGTSEVLQDRVFRLGTVTEGESTQAKSIDGTRTIHLNGIMTTGRPTHSGNRGFKDRGSLFRVVEEYQSGIQPHSSIMYLLGRTELSLWDGTERNLLTKEAKLHRPTLPELGNLQTITLPANDQSGVNLASDCMLIDSKYGKALYCQGAESEVTKKFRPSYLHFLSGSSVLGEDARRDFLEAFNFSMGKRFLEIGHTEFDQSNAFIRRSSRSPYSYNLKREVHATELSPSLIQTNREEMAIDPAKVSKLIDLYLDAKTSMNLSEVMWRIWTARAMPLGQQLVQYGAALETLINAWFDKPENEDRRVYVAKADFKARTKTFLDQLRATTFPSPAETTNWTRVIDQLSGANKISLADRYRYFMADMGLQSGDVEKELLDSRNLYAHGNNIKDSDAKRLAVLRRGFEALLNRCILKTAGFTGNYRDFSSLDFPERQLEEQLRGPNGDGRI